MRLKKMLDGGRPLAAVTKDCFCKKTEKNHYGDGAEMKILERAKQDLEEQLKGIINVRSRRSTRHLQLLKRYRIHVQAARSNVQSLEAS